MREVHVPGAVEADPRAYERDGLGTRTLELLEGGERYLRWVFSWIEPFLGDLNVEIGAGHGALTSLALKRHRVLACEPSEFGRSVLERRFVEQPRYLGAVEDFASLPQNEEVDAVFSANVLEHLADDVAILARASGMLRRGGRFVAVVPAGAWLYSRFDARIGHHRRYTRADRVRLEVSLAERRVPLKLVRFVHRNPVGALGWMLKMRLLGREELDPADMMRLEMLVPWLRLLDAVPLPVGQSLILAWERT